MRECARSSKTPYHHLLTAFVAATSRFRNQQVGGLRSPVSSCGQRQQSTLWHKPDNDADTAMPMTLACRALLRRSLSTVARVRSDELGASDTPPAALPKEALKLMTKPPNGASYALTASRAAC